MSRKNSYKRISVQAALAACLLMVFAFVFTAPAAVAQQDDLYARMKRVEGEIDTLSRAVFKGERPPVSAATTSGSAGYQADVEQRLSDLEKQMRDLTGRIEQQDYAMTQLKERVDRTLTDMELRMKDSAAVAAPQAGAPAQTGTSGTLSANDMGGPTDIAPTTPTDDMTLGNPPSTAGAIPADPNAPASANSPTVQNLGSITETPGGATIAPKPGDDPAGQYEMAFSQLKGGNSQSAKNGFEEFLKKYPTHPLAPNATYWLGESYYAAGEYDKAARIFAESYKKYPQGPKVADSLLKMGMSLGQGGKIKEACITLQKLKEEFPSGQGVSVRRGEQEMAKLGCAG